MIRATTSTSRRTLPSAPCLRLALPKFSSSESSLRVFALPFPNLSTSMPNCVSRSASAVSSMPMGGNASVEIAPVEPRRYLTPLVLACFRLTHLYRFPVPGSPWSVPSGFGVSGRAAGLPSVVVDLRKLGAVIDPSRKASTISTRYMVLTPGYDRESSSSSQRVTLSKSRRSASGGIRRSLATIRFATRCVFSWGFFLLPGRRPPLNLEDSSDGSTSMRNQLPLGVDTRSNTMSTTRTSCLYRAASIISRALPCSTSSTNWSRDFAPSTPKSWVSTL
mmetsp:Transcript_42385/g.119887  ORF Transcript_42385/g.119887 Transcript_42385/m.119887 type:complete len:277 (-) Transcript_42385:529-1359(-)